MKHIKQIAITTPCTQSWNDMAVAEQGRHCQSCCKTVIDFTAMSNTDVIAYLTSHKNTCGRITAHKLAAVNHQLQIENRKRFSWKGLIAAASLSMLFPAIHAKAKPVHQTEQMPVMPANSGQVAATDSVVYITIKGVIKAKDDGLPIAGATVKVKVKGNYIGAVTAVDGSFTLHVPASAKRLIVSFIGYETQEIKLRTGDTQKPMELMLVMSSNMLGGFGMY